MRALKTHTHRPADKTSGREAESESIVQRGLKRQREMSEGGRWRKREKEGKRGRKREAGSGSN